MNETTRKSSGAAELFNPSSSPVLLDHERALTEGRDDRDVFNDFGFVIRARAETGEDVHLWVFAYRQKGKEVVIDGDLNQTLLMYGKYTDDEKQQMRDAPYINKGQNLEDYMAHGTLKVAESETEVQWSIAGREYVAKPPIWKISGEHAGVRCDITVHVRRLISPLRRSIGLSNEVWPNAAWERSCRRERPARRCP